MASIPFLGLIGWYFVPHFITKQLLRLRSVFLSKPSSDPRTEYKVLYALVVVTYALYNLVEGARGIEGNFYQVLNVGKDVDNTGIVKAFRAFARRYVRVVRDFLPLSHPLPSGIIRIKWV